MIILCSNLWAASIIIRPGFNVEATEDLYNIVTGSDDSLEAVEAVKKAISAGACLGVKNYYSGFTLLHCAVKNKLINVVSVLLVAGVFVDVAPIPFKITPLYVAAGSDERKEIAELLIRFGADKNSRTWNGSTPLHAAVENNAKKMVIFLLESGAIVEEKNMSVICRSCYPTPLDLVILSKHKHLWQQRNPSPEIVHLLMKNGARMPDRMTEEEVVRFDSIIKEINNKIIQEQNALFALSRLLAAKKNTTMKAYLLERLYPGELLPLASQVYAQRAAAAKIHEESRKKPESKPVKPRDCIVQ